MKRFVDIRGQGTAYRFAWFSTNTDTFETHSDNMCWDTLDEFLEDYKGDEKHRYINLTPEWAKVHDENDKLWKDDES